MILLMATIIIALAWLGYETDWMRVRLLVGKTKPKYARYEVYGFLKNKRPNYTTTPVYTGSNMPEGYKWDGEPCYNIILSPGIKDVLCGFNWLNKHCADLVDYHPIVEMNIGNVRYKMHILTTGIIKDVMKANKLTGKQKLAIA